MAALVTGSLVQMFQPPPGTSKQPPRTLSAPVAHPQPGFEMLQRKEAISQGLVMAPAGGCGLMGVCGCTHPAALHRDAAPSLSCWMAISGDGNKGKRGSVAVLRVWGVQVGWFTTLVLWHFPNSMENRNPPSFILVLPNHCFHHHKLFSNSEVQECFFFFFEGFCDSFANSSKCWFYVISNMQFFNEPDLLIFPGTETVFSTLQLI